MKAIQKTMTKTKIEIGWQEQHCCVYPTFPLHLVQGKTGPEGRPGRRGEQGPPGLPGLPTLYLWKNTAEEWAAFQVRW